MHHSMGSSRDVCRHWTSQQAHKVRYGRSSESAEPSAPESCCASTAGRGGGDEDEREEGAVPCHAMFESTLATFNEASTT